MGITYYYIDLGKKKTKYVWFSFYFYINYNKTYYTI